MQVVYRDGLVAAAAGLALLCCEAQVVPPRGGGWRSVHKQRAGVGTVIESTKHPHHQAESFPEFPQKFDPPLSSLFHTKRHKNFSVIIHSTLSSCRCHSYTLR
jgi:hypothetical protein